MTLEDDAVAESLPIKVGDVVNGKYRIEGLLALGGMGAVFRARHELLDQRVALKIMRPELARQREPAQRFLREARAAATIQSDHVAKVSDVGCIGESVPFMVMEFLVGEDLEAAVSGDRWMPIDRAVDILLQALAGVAAAHARGIVHRDIKPSNLFLERRDGAHDRVKVLDFGISKVSDDESDALRAGATTRVGAMMGTPRYMSPEQIADSKRVDAGTDLWALGLVAYELLAGRYPFEAETSGELLSKILGSPIPSIRSARPEVPDELERAVFRALEKSRPLRYERAEDFMRALAPFGSSRVRLSLVSEVPPAPARSSRIDILQVAPVAKPPLPTVTGVMSLRSVPGPGGRRMMIGALVGTLTLGVAVCAWTVAAPRRAPSPVPAPNADPRNFEGEPVPTSAAPSDPTATARMGIASTTSLLPGTASAAVAPPSASTKLYAAKPHPGARPQAVTASANSATRLIPRRE